MSPPTGVNESCIALTLPLEAAVVAHAQIPEFTIPKRSKGPEMQMETNVQLPAGNPRADLGDDELRAGAAADALVGVAPSYLGAASA